MQNNTLSLSNLHDGETGIIISMENCGELKRRLMDLGFIEGTTVRCLYRSPAGNPVAYMVRGTVIALRKDDSTKIIIHRKG
jgi:ferrous iron transport protein A